MQANALERSQHASIFDFTSGEVETPPDCDNFTSPMTTIPDIAQTVKESRNAASAVMRWRSYRC
ncbi:hypothetical protein [Mesorhizobium sp. CN2-181]|uniref:hypothetical protein n=1 Tax=Mesorhizobium yinganensis TaxID=3157707 RepID=UPI0032B78AD6